MNLRALWAVARLYLHPQGTRRRIRELNQLAARLQLGNRRLAETNLALVRRAEKAERENAELRRQIADTDSAHGGREIWVRWPGDPTR